MSKEYRQAKKAYKSQGYTGKQAKRFAATGAGETELMYEYGGKTPMSYKKGGKLPSYNKKKHRGAIKK
jgi:hypothetical protein